jgi:hypothetical protein
MKIKLSDSLKQTTRAAEHDRWTSWTIGDVLSDTKLKAAQAELAGHGHDYDLKTLRRYRDTAQAFPPASRVAGVSPEMHAKCGSPEMLNALLTTWEAGQKKAAAGDLRVTAERVRKIIMRGDFHDAPGPPRLFGEQMHEYMPRGLRWRESPAGKEAIQAAQAQTDAHAELARELLRQGQLIDLGGSLDTYDLCKEGERAAKILRQGFALDGRLPHPFPDGYILNTPVDGRQHLVIVLPPEPGKSYINIILYEAMRPLIDNPTKEIVFSLRADGKLAFDAKTNGLSVRDRPCIYGQEQIDFLLATGFYIMCYALVLINTRFVEVERVGTPETLNAARAKRGKPPLPSYLRVKNSAEYITAITGKHTTGSGTRADGAGAHASPLPHTRRSHYRVFGKPTRDGRLQTLVRACRVNMRDADMRDVSSGRGHYQVALADEE